jgi:hypothetical protein
VTTARSKTDTIQTDDKKIKKVGLKDIQREGFEYELTVSFNIDRDGHYATASKDRTSLFIDHDPFVISQKTGEELLAWTESGVDVPVDLLVEKNKVLINLSRLKFPLVGSKEEKAASIKNIVMALTSMDVTDDTKVQSIVRALETYTDSEQAFAKVEQYAFENRDEGQDKPATTDQTSPTNYPPKPWQNQDPGGGIAEPASESANG